jgi:predicted ATPase
MPSLPPGTVLGGYRLEAEIDRGGMGTVYRARQLSLDRTVAVKVLSPALASDPAFVRRFRQEAILAASLEHPNVVPVHERGEDGGHLYIAMRLITGDSLRERIQREGPLAPPRAVGVLEQIAEALDAAHAAGLVHRDVKPANVLLAGEGAAATAYLSDFGIARRTSASRLTSSGVMVGTPGYLAPEVIRGEPGGPPADVYALGCVLYEMLTGTQPFPRPDVMLTLSAHLTEPPPQAAGVPPAMNDVIARAMHKRAEDRFARPSHLAEAARAALTAPTGPGSGARLAAAAIRPGTGPIIGRTEDQAALTALLRDADVRVVSVTGPGGIGKTRLALAVADELQGAFADGVHWTDLAAVTSPLQVLSSLAQSLGLREEGARPLRDQLVERLRELDLLIVMDNVEHLLDAGTSVAELLTACPRLRLLVTSRAPLRLSGEHEYPLAPLDQAAATELFDLRARAARPEFSPDTAVAEICGRLDCLPLAIELCAARIRVMTPQTMLERLDRMSLLSLLGSGPRDAPARQRTLRATLDWSHDLLGPDEQVLLARLSVFAGGFGLEAAESVCGAELDTLAALVDQSLVRFAGDRYSMLETVREYAREKLAGSGESERVRSAHAEWCLGFAEDAIRPLLAGGGQAAAIGRLATEDANVGTALEFARDQGDAERALRLAYAMAIHRYFSGSQVTLGLDQVERTLSAFDAPAGSWGRAAFGAGWLAFELGLLDHARSRAEAALALADESSSPKVLAETLNLLGAIAITQDDLDRAEPHFEAALGVARRGEAPTSAASALNNLGLLNMMRGEPDQARRRLDSALEVAAETGDAHTLASAELNLGLLDAADRRPEPAIGHFRRALEELAGSNSLSLVASASAGLALAAAQRGDERVSARLLGLVDAISDATGLALQNQERSAADQAAAMARSALGGAFAQERERGRSAIVPERAIATARQFAERLGEVETARDPQDASPGSSS